VPATWKAMTLVFPAGACIYSTEFNWKQQYISGTRVQFNVRDCVFSVTSKFK
jgi:hypothetical protein